MWQLETLHRKEGTTMIDSFKRTIDYLRISVTDTCNMQCVYCTPECNTKINPSPDTLSSEELLRICNCMARLGITKIKITGGEPLLRKDIIFLVKEIKSIPGIRQVTLTTNGVLLGQMIDALVTAGLDGVNISLDTLNPEHFHRITRRDQLSMVLDGLEKTLASSIPSVKLNTVAVQELNGEELLPLIELTRNTRLSVRFIELMPMGMGRRFTPMSPKTILEQIEQAFGPLKRIAQQGNGPAAYYQLEDFKGTIGFINALSNEFCESCNRIRLTSSGDLKLCLHHNHCVSLKTALNNHLTDDQLCDFIISALDKKPLKHNFKDTEDPSHLELKNMIQIGG